MTQSHDLSRNDDERREHLAGATKKLTHLDCARLQTFGVEHPGKVWRRSRNISARSDHSGSVLSDGFVVSPGGFPGDNPVPYNGSHYLRHCPPH
jgi:hypothetical protein